MRCAPNAHVFVFIFILEISCQYLATLYTSIGFILPTIEGYMLVGEFLPHGPTVRGPIVHPEKVDSWAPDSWAPGPNCPGPNYPPPKSGQLGPGAQLAGAQLSTFSGWTIGPRTVGPWGRNPPTDIYLLIVGRIYPIPEY